MSGPLGLVSRRPVALEDWQNSPARSIHRLLVSNLHCRDQENAQQQADWEAACAALEARKQAAQEGHQAALEACDNAQTQQQQARAKVAALKTEEELQEAMEAQVGLTCMAQPRCSSPWQGTMG